VLAALRTGQELEHTMTQLINNIIIVIPRAVDIHLEYSRLELFLNLKKIFSYLVPKCLANVGKSL